MRRQQKYPSEDLVAYALAEIEKLKAGFGRITDGRVLVHDSTGGTAPGNGNGDGDDGGGPPPFAAAHVIMGSKHTKSLRVTAGTGLNADYEEGVAAVDETYYSIGASTIALTASNVNYVFVGNDGVVAKNTTAFPLNCIPLAEITTDGSGVTAVADRRTYLHGHDAPTFLGNVAIGGVLTVDTINEYTANVGVIVEGNLNKDSRIYPGGDSNYYLYMDGATLPRIVYDANDFMNFHRTANQWQWYLGNVSRMTFDGNLGLFGGGNILGYADAGATQTFRANFASGQLLLPISGIGAGILLGGDVQLYRSAANRLETPDDLYVNGAEVRLGTAGAGGNIHLYVDSPVDATAAETWIDTRTQISAAGQVGDSATVFIGHEAQAGISGPPNVDFTARFVASRGRPKLPIAAGKTVALAVGYEGYIQINPAAETGILTEYRAFDVGYRQVDGGSITNAYGLYVPDMTGWATGSVAGIYFAGSGGVNGIKWGTDVSLYKSGANTLFLAGALRVDYDADVNTFVVGRASQNRFVYVRPSHGISVYGLNGGHQVIQTSGDLRIETGFGGAGGSGTVAFGIAGYQKLGLSIGGQLSVPTIGSGAGILLGGDAQWYRNAANVLRTPDSVVVDGTLQVGTPPTYTPSNVTPDRSYNADVTTLNELADVLGTLIADLQTFGLLQ